MKNFIYICSFFLLICSSCKKEDKTYTVTYKVTENVPGSAPFSVRYTGSDGALKTEGPINSGNWTTPDMNGYKHNAIVSLYLDSPSGTYDLYILVDGNVTSHVTADGGFGEQLLETQLPN
ncbi:MAG TPA: hypothetical protein VFF27_11620 [Bacteroidia bacterium]|jgi:hypothetical protein|nr:hypothetical protein [Bacteroidia bacterium]